jgi:hypothetical protein
MSNRANWACRRAESDERRAASANGVQTCARGERAQSGRAACGRAGEFSPHPITTSNRSELLQLRVLRLGLLQDRNVGVGVFPEREEIVVGAASLGSVTL